MSSTTTPQTVIQGERALARVKWFNNKSGFGFLTVTSDGPHHGRDIFVHHSAIGVVNQQYKYLVQGEYVELFVLHLQSGEHEFQAANVCGVHQGKLMCETRNENRVQRTNFKSPHQDDHQKQEKEWTNVSSKPHIASPKPSSTSRRGGRGGRGAGRGGRDVGRGRGGGGRL